MKKNYLLIVVITLVCIASIFIIENTGYDKIKVDDGTLYGKAMGKNKDLVVLIIAGSGPTDMNGNSSFVKGRNDSLLELAKALAKEKISTFRYDKRTVGRSKKTFGQYENDFNILVDDCVAIIKYLKNNGYKRIVIAGHSEGSLIGMLAASREEVDGFISLAGAGNTIDITLEKQLMTLGADSPEIQIIRSLRENREITAVSEDEALFSIGNQEYILTWMAHNPSEIIKSLNIPVLVIQGDEDTQVDTDDFQLLIAGKYNHSSQWIGGMNHVLKGVNSSKENLATYSDPSYPLHHQLIPTITSFIKGL